MVGLPRKVLNNLLTNLLTNLLLTYLLTFLPTYSLTYCLLTQPTYQPTYLLTYRQYLPLVESIVPGQTLLFLFNFSDRQLHGLYR